jgi:membrane protein DedA with SNARE-associated domain
MNSFTTIATDLIQTLGLGGVAVGLTINCLGIPIPSEIIIPLSGIGIRQGHFNGWITFGVVVLSQMLGLFIAYAIGRFGGLELVQRYGKYMFISKHELEKAQKAFHRYGGRLVLFGLCLPGIHGYVGYPAGIAKMPVVRFATAAAVGVSIWSSAFLLIGYFLGDHLEQIDAVLHKFAIFIIVLLGLAAIWYIRRRNRKAPLEDSPDHTA